MSSDSRPLTPEEFYRSLAEPRSPPFILPDAMYYDAATVAALIDIAGPPREGRTPEAFAADLEGLARCFDLVRAAHPRQGTRLDRLATMLAYLRPVLRMLTGDVGGTKISDQVIIDLPGAQEDARVAVAAFSNLQKMIVQSNAGAVAKAALREQLPQPKSWLFGCALPRVYSDHFRPYSKHKQAVAFAIAAARPLGITQTAAGAIKLWQRRKV